MRNARFPELIEVESEELEEVLHRVEQSLDEKDSTLVRRVFESYAYVSDLIDDQEHVDSPPAATVLREALEKTAAVVGEKTEVSGASPSGVRPRQRPARMPALRTPDEPSESDEAASSKVTGRVTVPTLTGVPRGLRSGTRRSLRATRVPPCGRGDRLREGSPACSCRSSGSRRWVRRSTSCRNCVAICAVRCSRRARR